MPINILVIDDDKKVVQRLINNLKRADIHNKIGVCVVDDSVIQEENIELYNPMKFGVDFNVLLVDYQLCSQFTGVLVAAWIMLQIKVPKLTLTTGTYAGPKDCFEGFILKDELLSNPECVIEKLCDVVEQYNSKQWLEEQHKALVGEYQTLLKSCTHGSANYADENNLKLIETLLDKFEKVLDEEQEKEIKKRMAELENKSKYSENIRMQNDKIEVLSQRLENFLQELEKYDE